MRPRILITRALHQASALADALRDLGCDPILIPTIELAPPTTFAPLDAALARLDHFHWLIFTSANAVEAFHHRLLKTPVIRNGEAGQYSVSKPMDPERLGPDQSAETLFTHPLPPNLRVASIGPATTRAIEKLLGTKPALISPTPVAESLAEALVALTKDPLSRFFLFPRAENARNVIETALWPTKAELTIVPVYRNIVPEASISTIRTLFSSPESYPEAITFTSSSTAINLLALLEVSGITLPSEIPRISIGPITTQALHDVHISPTAEAAESTIPALAAAVIKALAVR
jgi:uroporphyrinogen-III synthase